jgi:hypothetical protein
VAGRVLDESGRPLGQVQIRMHSIVPNASAGDYSGSVDRSGRFQLTDVVAGNYMLRFKTRRTRGAGHRRSNVSPSTTRMSPAWRSVLGGAHVQGRVLRDTGVTRTLDPTGIRVQFQRIVSDMGLLLGGGRPDRHRWKRFSFEAPAGPMTIAIPNVPSGWMVRRILVDDAEIGDRPFELAAGVGHRVEVVLTDRITQLLGVVRDAKERTVTGADVLVFPEDAPRWTPGARSIKRARADAFGRFQIDALVPGDYLALAVDEPVPFALDDTALMQRFGAAATRVRIAEGERRANLAACDLALNQPTRMKAATSKSTLRRGPSGSAIMMNGNDGWF